MGPKRQLGWEAGNVRHFKAFSKLDQHKENARSMELRMRLQEESVSLLRQFYFEAQT